MFNKDSGIAPRNSAVTILFVDPYIETRNAYVGDAEHAGFSVTAAGDGHEALAFVRTSPPAIVFTEVMLEGIGGLDLARRLRDMPRPVPVVLLTGIVLPNLAALARAAGCASLLTKPCPFETVERTIRRVLNAKVHDACRA